MVRVAVIAAGSGLTLSETILARRCEVVIAVDRGFKAALAAGCRVDRLIGDLDSLTRQGRADAERLGVIVDVYPSDKDESDLELALRAAQAVEQVDTVHVFGVVGGRPDHTAINLAVLTAPALADLEIVAHLGELRLHVVRDNLQIEAEPGAVVSLLAYGGDVTGVTTEGLQWPLADATLGPHEARGLSNVVVDENSSVQVGLGALLVFVEEPPPVSELELTTVAPPG